MLRAKRKYDTEVKSIYDILGERESLVRKKENFKEAIELALTFNDENIKYLEAQNKAIYWLIEAIKYHPKGIDGIKKSMNLTKFLFSLQTIHKGDILFGKDALPLLELLKNIIVDLNFGTFQKYYVNKYLSNFTAENTTLRRLDISESPAAQANWSNLEAKHMHYIADGLKNNSTLEILDLTDQQIGDEGLNILLEALSNNSSTKLKVLNLSCTDITKKGQEALENFMKTNKTLECIDLSDNLGISTELINALANRNKLAREESEKTLGTAPPTLPSMIEIDKNIPKGSTASAHASKRIVLNNPTIEEKATLNVSVGFNSRNESKLADNASKKATALIEKMQLSKHFDTSTKLLFLMGKSTYLETYTPDKDGIMKDENGITGQKNSMICKFTSLNGYELAKDVQSAVKDSSKNCVLVSAKPMRK